MHVTVKEKQYYYLKRQCLWRHSKSDNLRIVLLKQILQRHRKALQQGCIVHNIFGPQQPGLRVSIVIHVFGSSGSSWTQIMFSGRTCTELELNCLSDSRNRSASAGDSAPRPPFWGVVPLAGYRTLRSWIPPETFIPRLHDLGLAVRPRWRSWTWAFILY